MDKNLIYGILISLFVAVLLGTMYLFHYRIKSLEASKLQLQKHILYHQQIIERYNRALQSSNIEENFQDVPLEPIRPQEVQPNPSPVPQAGINLQNILPMMSSIMSIMQPSTDTQNIEESEENDDEAKKELENEIENELKELQQSILSESQEGRVDDLKIPTSNDVKEVSSVTSDVKSVYSVESKEPVQES